MKRLVLVVVVLVLVTPVVGVATLAGAGAPARGAVPSATAVAEIPPALLPVYQAAAVTCPGLPWEVLAAIGWVESRHGGGRLDATSGDVVPPLLGPPLDGRGGRAAIQDPDVADGWAHAVGPMQFLRSTWGRWATLAPDRPPGATPDPHNAFDAIYTAARYLCGGRPGLGDLRRAIFSYNRSDAYVAQVLAKAEAYADADPHEPGNLLAGSATVVIAAAMSQLGVPYVWGGATPAAGFDCSGLVQWAYAQAGIALPRTTAEQILVGRPVAVGDLRPGDLVFSRSYRGGQVVDLGHVAIYAGGGQVIVSPQTGEVVSLRPLVEARVQAARRVLDYRASTEATATSGSEGGWPTLIVSW